MSKQQKQSAISAATDALGDLAHQERKDPKRDQHLSQIFKYIDEDNQGFITCYQLSKFLEQNGVIASEVYVYDTVMNFRAAKSDGQTFGEKPAANEVTIKEHEFKELMLLKGLPASDIKDLKATFSQLAAISPGLVSPQGALQSQQLWSLMRFWGIMNQDEIDQTKVFFGWGNKQSDNVMMEKYLDSLIE